MEPGRIAAIGYCFGGRTVLDLARLVLGAPLAPFHAVAEAQAPLLALRPDAESSLSSAFDSFWLIAAMQLGTIPQICTPKGGAVNSEVFHLGGPSPAAVEWLNHAACFAYATPPQEQLVETVFRQCRYDARPLRT